MEFPVPWYLPILTVFALIVISSLLDHAMGSRETVAHLAGKSHGRMAARRRVTAIAAALLCLGALAITACTASQLKLQQSLIEHGQRREIGRWLRAHSSPGVTVFLQPLG